MGAELPPPRLAGSDNSRGVLAFVFAMLALLGLTCGNLLACPFGTLLGVFAPIAWKLAHDERAARRSRGEQPDGMTEAGWITALVTTGLLLLAVLATVAVLVFAGAVAFKQLGSGF